MGDIVYEKILKNENLLKYPNLVDDKEFDLCIDPWLYNCLGLI